MGSLEEKGQSGSVLENKNRKFQRARERKEERIGEELLKGLTGMMEAGHDSPDRACSKWLGELRRSDKKG